jgi:hypothetical protein
MRDANRIDNFLRLLGEEWHKQGEDLRFTQFMFNNDLSDFNGFLYHMEEHKVLEKFFPDINPREYTYWGTYGKSGKDPIKFILVKDLETDHIQAILTTVPSIKPSLKETLQNELILRTKDA